MSQSLLPSSLELSIWLTSISAILPFHLTFCPILQTGEARNYICTRRDEVVASIIDGAWSSKNRIATVNPVPSRIGLRAVPLDHDDDENIETIFMKHLGTGRYLR